MARHRPRRPASGISVQAERCTECLLGDAGRAVPTIWLIKPRFANLVAGAPEITPDARLNRNGRSSADRIVVVLKTGEALAPTHEANPSCCSKGDDLRPGLKRHPEQDSARGGNDRESCQDKNGRQSVGQTEGPSP